MTKPDFKLWAIYLLNNDPTYEEVEETLRQVFDQGYYLGKREGFEDGDKNGWWKDLDADPRVFPND